jgi:Ca2+-binding RTX toxin-like protein
VKRILFILTVLVALIFPVTASADPVLGKATCGGVLATIVGTDGNDQTDLAATSGPDVIQMGKGDDSITGAGGDDIICGGPGNDRILGGTGNDKVNGGQGDDFVWGSAGAAGDDVEYGERGNDNVNGGVGNDKLFGGGGLDLLNCADGNDIGNGGKDADHDRQVACELQVQLP